MGAIQNILEKEIEVKIRTNISTLRILTKFLTEEFLGVFDMIMQEEGMQNRFEMERYKLLRETAYALSENFYGNLVDAEREIVEKLKNKKIDDDKIIDVLSENEEDRERIGYICKALKAIKVDEVEKKLILEKLDKGSLGNLLKIEEAAKDELYTPHLYKFFLCLYDSLDQRGEIVFSENSLGQILDLERDDLEEFLDKLTEIKIKIGRDKKRLVENFSFLNQNTVKVEYDLSLVKPNRNI